MNKKKFKERFNLYQQLFSLDSWRITYCFRKLKGKDNRKLKNAQKMQMGETSSDATYSEAHICFLNLLLKEDNFTIDNVIVHELIHVLQCEFTGYIDSNTKQFMKDKFFSYFQEKQVSVLSHILLNVIYKGK